MGQTRCCLVCLIPQSQVSCSFDNPHFIMFTLDRPTCVRNRLSAFQVVQGFSVPSGRCSSALTSRGSSVSLHNDSSKRASFAVVLMGSGLLMMKFSVISGEAPPRDVHWVGAFSPVVCRVRSVQLATALDGAIPASTGRLLVCVGFSLPVIILPVSFSVASSFFAWVESSHTGQNQNQNQNNVYLVCRYISTI